MFFSATDKGLAVPLTSEIGNVLVSLAAKVTIFVNSRNRIVRIGKKPICPKERDNI